MSDWRIDEQQLLALNTVLQRADDVLVTNCVTRTAQESKLFPILPYLDLVMIESYWRWPDLLRQVAAERAPEELGHRLREVSTTMTHLTAWSSLNYYLNGRSLLIRHGLIAPEDNLEDLWFMVDFHQRLKRAFHRSSGHVWALDAGDIAQVHEERTLQVFEADAFEADDALRHAAGKFVAAATQFNFLVHCESRSGLSSSGPYNLGGRRLLHTRDFLNMTECGLSWMDGIGTDLPYANLTVTLITDGVSMEITDWGSAYTTPEDYQDSIIGVGLYTSDLLCDRYLPVGMDSPRELTDTFATLTEQVTAATRELYSRFAGMSFDQMVEAGIQTYLRAPVDLSMMAGTYSQAAWDLIDDRTRRLWPLYNEEYALDAYVDNFAAMIGSTGSASDYYLHPVSYAIWRRGGAAGDLPTPGRNAHLVPARVVDVDDYARRANPNGLADVRGSYSLPAKTGGYTFACGRLTEDELNARARAFSSPLTDGPWRNLDEPTVKYHWQDPEVDAMYRYSQERSRLLRDRGAALRRPDIDAIRREAGERPWHEVTSEAIAGGVA
jgi:hypothetical protein